MPAGVRISKISRRDERRSKRCNLHSKVYSEPGITDTITFTLELLAMLHYLLGA